MGSTIVTVGCIIALMGVLCICLENIEDIENAPNKIPNHFDSFYALPETVVGPRNFNTIDLLFKAAEEKQVDEVYLYITQWKNDRFATIKITINVSELTPK